MREHLDGCEACAHLERRLAAVTPRPFLEVDPGRQAQMWARLDAAVDEAWRAEQATPAPRAAAWLRTWWWLSEEMRVPAGAMLAYAGLLAMAVAWGASNWWSAQQLQVALDQYGAPEQFVVPAEIPTSDFEYISWTPDEAPTDAADEP